MMKFKILFPPLFLVANLVLAQLNFEKIETGEFVEDQEEDYGGSFVDYNQDGFLDIYVPNAYNQFTSDFDKNSLYKNDGVGAFNKINNLNINSENKTSLEAVWADFDNDGLPDLFVGGNREGPNNNNLLFKQNSDNSFTKILSPDFVNYSNAISALWADFDNDGLLDLLILSYIDQFSYSDHFLKLYKNIGNAEFELVYEKSGTTGENISACDYDNDNDLDILLLGGDGNRARSNILLKNNGSLSFSEQASALSSGSYKSFSASWSDYNNDGFTDVFIANYNEANLLFKNDGDGSFTKITEGAIVEDIEGSISSNWGDINNDGYVDLFVGNSSNHNNSMYLNNSDGTFSKLSSGAVVEDNSNYRSQAIFGDYDNDGDLDLYASNNASDYRNSFYRNTLISSNWLEVKLEGVASNRDGLGASVLVKADGLWQKRDVMSIHGRGAHNSLIPHFGLGNSFLVDSVVVNWPSGAQQVLTGISSNQLLAINEFYIEGPVSTCSNDSITYKVFHNAEDQLEVVLEGDGTIIQPLQNQQMTIRWNSVGRGKINVIHQNGLASSLSIETFSKPTSGFTVSSTEICQSDTVDLKYTGELSSDLTLIWHLNDGQMVHNQQDSLIRVVWPSFGVKDVVLEATSNGCTSYNSYSITVIKTPTSNFSIQSWICDGESAIVTYTGNGSATASYLWDFNGGTVISGDGKGPYEVSWATYGTKFVSLSVQENGCVSELQTHQIEYNAYPALFFEANNSACYNENYEISFTGSDYTDLYWDFDGANILSGSGAGPYVLKWGTSGRKLISVVASNNGCSRDSTIMVDITDSPHIPDICMVTVDENSGKNRIVWDYDLESIAQFGIYRETNISGEYFLIEYVDANFSNTYIDDQSAPEQQANRYRITGIDSCGTETSLSSYHKTIHLTINQGIGNSWNLIWDGYEGFPFGSYRIFRSLDGGEFELLAEIASNLSSYTDTEVVASEVAYQIEVLNSNNCDVKAAGRISANSSSRSNIARNNSVTGIYELESSVVIYPNPSSNHFFIQLGEGTSGTYTLSSSFGQVIKLGKISANSEIEVKADAAGIYFLTLKTNKGVITKRMVKH